MPKYLIYTGDPKVTIPDLCAGGVIVSPSTETLEITDKPIGSYDQFRFCQMTSAEAMVKKYPGNYHIIDSSGGMVRMAKITPCEEYRSELVRIWDPEKPLCVWCCMNPSTADSLKDDPSVRKMIGFSKLLGYGGFHLFNVIPLRSPYPKYLLSHPAPRHMDYGPSFIRDRAKEILHLTSKDPVIMACGEIPKPFRRDALEVIRALSVVRCLGFTKSGMPRHPLMLPYSTKIITTDFSRWLDMAEKEGMF